MLQDFIVGFRYGLCGIPLVSHKGIRWFVIIPVAMNILLFSLLIVYGYHQMQQLNHWIVQFLPAWLSWLTSIFTAIFNVLVLLVVFYTFTLLMNFLASPFNGMLAEKLERLLSDYSPPSENRIMQVVIVLLHAVWSEIKKLFYLAMLIIPLCLISIIPVINIFAPVLWLIFAAWMLTLEYIDYPMGNHNISFSQQRTFMRSHRSLSIGFGTALLLMTSIPVINFIAMPASVCAATKLWVERLQGFYKTC